MSEFIKRHPYGLSPVTFTTWHAPEGIAPDKDTLRGLVRRGWVKERNGIFYATDTGIAAYKFLK